MTASNPKILALDFDGVICDGLKEYFQTAWQAYCQIWQPANRIPSDAVVETFYRLRPVIETGWEMPLVLRALELGIAESEILVNWGMIAAQLVGADAAMPRTLATTVDGIRDGWIEDNLDSWLAEHRFYRGVIERLREVLASPIELFIISTKEERFIRQLLQREGLELADRRVFGKAVKRPKSAILQDLNQEFGPTVPLWFVEDRLKTLQSVEKFPELANVLLFLADWGYNTAAERASIQTFDRILPLSLDQFNQAFVAWLPDS
jgi:phosphoglycolate phosphatase-like HAD superfamily hydrolase